MKTRLIGALVVSSWALGCGGFDNGPLQTGTLRGTVANVNATDPAWIWVEGVTSPARLNADGSFVLEDVPVGEVKVMVIANSTEAVTVPTVVQPATRVDVPVTPSLGGFFLVDLRDSGDPIPGAAVTVLGTPFSNVAANGVGETEGSATVGPLPPGCYRVQVTAPGWAPAFADACVNGAETISPLVELEDH